MDDAVSAHVVGNAAAGFHVVAEHRLALPRRRLRAGVMALATLITASAAAQTPAGRTASASGLPDPTRPPAAIYQPSGTATVESSAPRLQSVLVAPGGGRRVAVINGQTLRVGDKFQGAVLTSVTDTEAVLVQGRQRQVLKLSPSEPSPATIR